VKRKIQAQKNKGCTEEYLSHFKDLLNEIVLRSRPMMDNRGIVGINAQTILYWAIFVVMYYFLSTVAEYDLNLSQKQ
jgi:hypothetical protein